MGDEERAIIEGMGTLVYKYGLLPPVSEAEYVRDQMMLAHRYKNRLIEIERERREGSREVERAAGDVEALRLEKEQAQKDVDDAVLGVKSARAAGRRRAETDAMRERLKLARDRLKLARSRWAEARKTAREDPAIIEKRKSLWQRASERTREARAGNGLHWGTGAIIDQAVEAASKMPLYALGEPADPRFKRWTGEGSVGVQVHQKGATKTGLSVSEATTGSGDARSWLRIERAESPRGVVADSKRSRKRMYARLHVRLGTREDGSPLMACWPMVMHRPLPSGAIVKRVSVSVRRVGPREEWSCELTISCEQTKEGAPKGSGVVAVDFGWLATPDGLRVATWVDERGCSEQLVLTGRDHEGLLKPDELRSGRDKDFNKALARLVEHLRERGMPTWMRALTVRKGEREPTERQAIAYLSGWRSPARLASLCRRWRELREAGDAAAFEALEAWRYHDFHLWSWQESQRRSSIRRRLDIYRNFAADLAKRYERVVVGDVDYADLARRPVASDDVVIDAAALNRKNASPGTLRLALKQAFLSRGGEYSEVDCRGLSTMCPGCGSSDPGQRVDREHMIACFSCREYTPDLDTVMCLNLLRRAGRDEAVDAIVKRSRAVGARLRNFGAKKGAMSHGDASYER